eukprot:scaffold27016_cov240-Cylindrotheca_fusiformis.AAC.1
MGFEPTSVERFSSAGMVRIEQCFFTMNGNTYLTSFLRVLQGNRIVLKGYDVEPIVEKTDEGITISAGSPCGDSGAETESPTGAPGSGGGDSSGGYVALGVASLFSKNTFALTLATLFFASTPLVAAQECTNEVTIEIYTDVLDNIIEDKFNLDECPTESLYFKHHSTVFGGYEGCVAE